MADLKNNFSVDGITLDQDNPEFKLALEYALYTNTSIYLTGKAGSGKTTFLKYLRNVTDKKIVILTPTGVAAVNAGGQTINSFFQIPPSIYIPNDKRLRTSVPSGDTDKSTIYDNFKYNAEKRKLIAALDMLIIDEVSMVRADMLDVIDTLLRVYRNSNQAFGGVQVILIGDTFQLPPVVNKNEKELFYRFYESEFFFSANVTRRCKFIYIELKKIYRQNERDFIDLLNRVRVNKMLPSDFQTLNGKLDPYFKPSEDDKYIILATRNDRVSDINESRLDELETPQKIYTAKIIGEFPEKTCPTDINLKLKVNAQVMFIKNDREKRFYNGKIGKVTATNEDNIKVEIETQHGAYQELTITPEEWKNVVYRWDEKENCIKEEVVGKFIQYPLRLAWAITVHKSQGLTFERVIADIGHSFASGQVYVALSRCTSMNGLVLTSKIYPGSIITDNKVIEFAKNETPETLLTEQLSGSKADFYYSAARKAFRSRNADEMLDNFFNALKYRNDIGTDTFKRFVSVWTKKFFKKEKESDTCRNTILEQAEKIENQFKTIEKQSDIINEQSETITSQNSKIQLLSKHIDSLTDEIKNNEKTIKSKNNDLKLLENKIRFKESSIADKDHEITSMMASLAKNEERITIYNKRIMRLENKVTSLESELNSKNEEIKRLSSITWFQKLLGKK